jgi:hypothetical protein
MWVAIHMCMEAMLAISLYSYLYFKLAKRYVLLSLKVFSSTKLEKRAEQVLPGNWGVGGTGGWGEVAQTMYTHVSK